MTAGKQIIGDTDMATKDTRLIRADAEEKAEEKKEEARDDADTGHQLKDFIADMRSCMDSVSDSVKNLHSRMDAMEKERADSARKDAEDEEEAEEKKADARRKDAEDEEEAEGKAREVAADRKRGDSRRKDAEEDVKEEKARQDARRKDAEDEEERKEEKADAKADAEVSALKQQLADLTRQLGEVTKFVQRPREDADASAMADAQAAADEVFSAMGKRAPAPFASEDAAAYNRRMALALKGYSPRFKDANLHAIADSVVFEHTLRGIYADALEFARSPAAVPEGTLLPIKRERDGHRITEWQGSSRSWMDPMSGAAQAVTNIHSN